MSDNTLSMSAKVVNAKTSAGWPDANHDTWQVRLQYQGRAMSLTYHTGYGHRVNGCPATPPIGYVLSSLASDASAAESCSSLEDFASEFGYDMDDATDRRRTRAIYTAINRQTQSLRQFLGDTYPVLADPPDGGDWSEFTGTSMELPAISDD